MSYNKLSRKLQTIELQSCTSKKLQTEFSQPLFL